MDVVMACFDAGVGETGADQGCVGRAEWRWNEALRFDEDSTRLDAAEAG